MQNAHKTQLLTNALGGLLYPGGLLIVLFKAAKEIDREEEQFPETAQQEQDLEDIQVII